MKSEKIITSSFSENGAKSMAKLLTTKYNCTIIDNPKFDKNSGMWITTYHDPSLGKDDETKRQTIESIGTNKRTGRSKLGAMENLGKRTKK
jgi:hypothetical protein